MASSEATVILLYALFKTLQVKLYTDSRQDDKQIEQRAECNGDIEEGSIDVLRPVDETPAGT